MKHFAFVILLSAMVLPSLSNTAQAGISFNFGIGVGPVGIEIGARPPCETVVLPSYPSPVYGASCIEQPFGVLVGADLVRYREAVAACQYIVGGVVYYQTACIAPAWNIAIGFYRGHPDIYRDHFHEFLVVHHPEYFRPENRRGFVERSPEHGREVRGHRRASLDKAVDPSDSVEARNLGPNPGAPAAQAL